MYFFLVCIDILFRGGKAGAVQWGRNIMVFPQYVLRGIFFEEKF